MTTLRAKAAAVVALTVTSVHAFGTEPPMLEHDPFARPPSQVRTEAGSQPQPDGSISPLDLRATMVASNFRLANIAGRTVRPGDEVQGYELLEVFEDRAVFFRDGDRMTVYVKPELEDDDE